MNEIFFKQSSLAELLKEPIIVFVCIFLIPIIIRFSKRTSNIKDASKKEVKRIVGLVTCVILLMFFVSYSIRLANAVDVVLENKNIIELKLPGIKGNNTGMYIDTDGRSIYFYTYENQDQLEEYFVGNLCEVEYYKLSRKVISVKIIE